MLSQVQGGRDVVLSFASCSFSPAERNYSATERELAAIRWSVKHFKPILFGRKYTIRTDHRPLIYLSNMKQIDSKLMRTLQDLNIGPYSIEYLPGKTNLVADALSRAVNLRDCLDEEDQSFKVDIPTDYITVPGGPNSLFHCLSLALYGNIDEHLVIRHTVFDRIIKDHKTFKIVNDKANRRQLLSMRNNEVLPCWQALLAFAVEYKCPVKVYQDGLGVVLFPAPTTETASVVHLHSLAGVHFNLMKLRNSINPCTVAAVEVAENLDNVLYLLEKDEGAQLNECKPFRCRKEVIASQNETEVMMPIQCDIIMTHEELLNAQNSDKDLKLLKSILMADKPIGQLEALCSNLGAYAHAMKKSVKDLKIKDSLVTVEGVPVLPEDIKLEILTRFHVASGHLGRDKMVAAVKDYYFCCGVTRVVTDIVHECNICQSFKGSARGGEPLCNRKTKEVLDQYAVDVLEVEPAKGNVKYLLVGVDIHSRFIHAVPIKNKQAETIAAALEQRILPSLHKVPKAIISDNGPEFRAQAFAQLLSRYSIDHLLTVPYLPQTNGRIERVNRTLLTMLATACAENDTTWIEELPRVLILYNHSKHSETGIAPAEFFTKDVKLPMLREV